MKAKIDTRLFDAYDYEFVNSLVNKSDLTRTTRIKYLS